MIPNKVKTTELELGTIADLTPDEKNANRGTQRGLAMLEDSLRRHGAGRSILVDKHGTVIAGNKTLESAASIGLEDVVIVKTDGTKIVAVQRTDIDLDTPEGRRLAVADNRTSEVGLDWDTDALSNLLADGLDTDGLFSAEELSDLLAVEPEPKDAPEAQLDRAEELRAQWGTERGQVWRVGPHRIMCGDSTDAGDVATLMDGAKAVMVFTDPPYAIYGSSTGVSNDAAMIQPFFRELWKSLLATGASDVYMCCDWRSLSTIENASTAYVIKDVIVWDKGSGGLGNPYRRRHEFVVFARPAPSSTKMFGRTQGLRGITDDDVWEVPRQTTNGDKHHNAEKPLELSRRAMANSSDPEDVVVDLFIGSGTTLVAAEQLGRVGYGMEIEPRYVAVALQRMADMGLTPERA